MLKFIHAKRIHCKFRKFDCIFIHAKRIHCKFHKFDCNSFDMTIIFRRAIFYSLVCILIVQKELFRGIIFVYFLVQEREYFLIPIAHLLNLYYKSHITRIKCRKNIPSKTNTVKI